MKFLAKEFFHSDAQTVMVEQRCPQTPFPLHDHDFHEIMIVLSGNGWHLLNDEPHFISCGELFYIRADDQDAYEQMATTPHNFLVKLRLVKAMRALRATNDSVTDIAFACGFNDSNYFSCSFSRMTGMAPGEYRRMPRLNDA